MRFPNLMISMHSAGYVALREVHIPGRCYALATTVADTTGTVEPLVVEHPGWMSTEVWKRYSDTT